MLIESWAAHVGSDFCQIKSSSSLAAKKHQHLFGWSIKMKLNGFSSKAPWFLPDVDVSCSWLPLICSLNNIVSVTDLTVFLECYVAFGWRV